MNGLTKPRCFVVMPFSDQLHFLYLFLKQHIETEHDTIVYRGDDWVETQPMIDKIRDQIDDADVVLADLTGASPNVLYEVGWAHARDKDVIFLTQDPPGNAPVDLAGYEVIQYELSKRTDLPEKLDSAFARLLRGRYSELYQRAREILTQFNQETGRHDASATEDDFRLLVTKSRERFEMAGHADQVKLLLPRIVEDPYDPDFMAAMTQYLEGL